MEKYIKQKIVEDMLGLSKSTLLREEKTGRFPKRYRLSRNVTAYKESEVLAWMASRVQEVTKE